MKCTAKITSNGRITLSAEVRRALGVHNGDSVVFEKDSDGAWVLRKCLRRNVKRNEQKRAQPLSRKKKNQAIK